MTRRSLVTLVVAALLALALVAVAAAATKSKSKTVTVAKGKTRTVIVASVRTHQGSEREVQVRGDGDQGRQEDGKISKGSAEGGSVCQAKITNRSNGSATVKVTADDDVEPEQQG